jgi:hypothetical protein
MSKYYTGIGSRKTPEDIQGLMTRLAYCLEKKGYILRSGAAEGADSAFERGVRNDENKEVYIPWENFNDRRSSETGVHALRPSDTIAFSLAEEVHPAWDKLSQGGQKLHARNVYQVLGLGLDEPSELLFCWAPTNGKQVTGGTATAVSLARKHKVRVLNLYNQQDRTKVERWLERAEANLL